MEPYEEIDGNVITVYAEKHRIDQYTNVLRRWPSRCLEVS